MNNLRKSFFLALSFLLSGCSYGLIQHGKIQPSLTELIKEQTVKERELDFLYPVDIEFSNIEKTKKLFRQIIERDLTPEEMENLQKAFAAFGLLKEKEIELDKVVDLYAEQAAGFYDPITKKLYLTDWLSKKPLFISLLEFMVQEDLTGELLLSHELTHAIQDQHFNLEKYILEGKENLDQLLARHSVIEGDATIASFNVTLSRFGKRIETTPDLSEKIQKEAKNFGSGLENLSPIIREHLIFPYYGGLHFCREVYLAEGWEGVNNLFKKPPLSTEQILHPEKYLKVPDNPLPIKKPNLDFLTKKNLRLVLENTFGELGSRLFLSQFISEKRARVASEGWGNDRFWVWESEVENSKYFILWITLWDSQLDAKEFYTQAFRSIQKRRRKQGISKKQFQEGKINIPYGNNRHLFMENIGNRVVILDGFSEELIEQVVKAL